MGVLDEMLTDGIKKEHTPSIAAFFWRIVLIVFVSWSLGSFGGMGFDGFARAGEVRQVTADLRNIRIEQIEARLFETRIKQCAATTDDARQFYREKIQGLLKLYADLTGHLYEIPKCDEL